MLLPMVRLSDLVARTRTKPKAEVETFPLKPE
jgi:hypothetical protein